jgi:hypothetical protein
MVSSVLQAACRASASRFQREPGGVPSSMSTTHTDSSNRARTAFFCRPDALYHSIERYGRSLIGPGTKGGVGWGSCRPLVLTEEAEGSRLFGAGSALREAATSSAGLAMENHSSGVALDVWRASAKLMAFFRVVSYSVDRQGVKYVSTVEGRDYPVYAVQWHPEKVRVRERDLVPRSSPSPVLFQGGWRPRARGGARFESVLRSPQTCDS